MEKEEAKKMDNHTTIEQLKEEVRKFCEERDWDQFHQPKDLAIGIITEASELLEHFRFKSEEEIKSVLKDKTIKKEISEEMADILYFLLRFSQMNGIDLSQSFTEKMKKNRDRYPIEKAKGSNKKYNQL